MPEARFKFSQLRQLLLDLGFQDVPVRRPFVGFEHAASDLVIVLPPYRSNASVAPHHLVYVRIMLDGKGLMDADKFDRIVAAGSTRHSASN